MQGNREYQAATSPLGGSYTENKIRRLMLPPLEGKSFLDLGCNAGYYCNVAKQKGAARVVGVDVDPKVIADARIAYPEVEFYDKGWDNFPDGQFDVAIILSAIHYAKDPIKVVSDVYEHLRPEGLLVLEGGLVDSTETWKSDCLIPGWRQVGDRCRHLSGGYLRRHLLVNFDWSIVGPSEPRGGDNVPRSVIHAKKLARKASRSQLHTVDLLEYAQGLAFSASTIVKEQPASAYVPRLGGVGDVAATLTQILDDPQLAQRFVEDLAYALEPGKSMPISIARTLPHAPLTRVVEQLHRKGFVAFVQP